MLCISSLLLFEDPSACKILGHSASGRWTVWWNQGHDPVVASTKKPMRWSFTTRQSSFQHRKALPPCYGSRVRLEPISSLSWSWATDVKYITILLLFCRFKHPCTGKYMHFSCPPPVDFAEILSQLRNISK